MPGARETFARHINDLGEIVGRYEDDAGRGYGLLLSGNDYTTIDVPGSIFTATSAINNVGEVVGAYDDAAGQRHGFLRMAGKDEYIPIDPPGSIGTLAVCINNLGEIVGEYDDSAQPPVHHGFLLSEGKFTIPIDAPEATWTSADGINDKREIVGPWHDANNHYYGYYATMEDGSTDERIRNYRLCRKAYGGDG